jgi:hypothetical protein
MDSDLDIVILSSAIYEATHIVILARQERKIDVVKLEILVILGLFQSDDSAPKALCGMEGRAGP